MNKFLIVLLILISLGVSSQFSYSESVIIKNYWHNASNDIYTTSRDVIKNKDWEEKNPLIKPLTNNLDAGTFQAGGLVLIGLLSNRWESMIPEDRQREMILAQLIEAGSNSFSHEDWQLEYGIQM